MLGILYSIYPLGADADVDAEIAGLVRLWMGCEEVWIYLCFFFLSLFFPLFFSFFFLLCFLGVDVVVNFVDFMDGWMDG